MRDYTKIEAWRLADDLTVAVYERTRLFPKDEVYGLTSQLRRASYSCPQTSLKGLRERVRKIIFISSISPAVRLSEAQYFIHLAAATGIFVLRGGR